MADYRSMDGLIDDKLARHIKNNFPDRKWNQMEIADYLKDNDPVRKTTPETRKYELQYLRAYHPNLFEERSSRSQAKTVQRMELKRSSSEWRDNTGNVRENTIKQYKLEGYRIKFAETKGLRVWKEGWKRQISLDELEQRRTAGKRSAAKRKKSR